MTGPPVSTEVGLSGADGGGGLGTVGMSVGPSRAGAELK